MHPKVSCGVFETNKGEPEFSSKGYQKIDASNRSFLRLFGEAAFQEGLKLDYKIHPFTKIRNTNPRALTDEHFDAEYAVCMYPDLDQIGPEFGHLIHNRRKSFRHIFVVTQRSIPDREHDMRKALNSLTTRTIEREVILEPTPTHLEDGEERFDLEAANILSYWNVLSIRCPEFRQQMMTILAIT